MRLVAVELRATNFPSIKRLGGTKLGPQFRLRHQLVYASEIVATDLAGWLGVVAVRREVLSAQSGALASAALDQLLLLRQHLKSCRSLLATYFIELATLALSDVSRNCVGASGEKALVALHLGKKN